MDDIIQKIIDSEKMAQIVVSEAREERLYHESRMLADIDAYRKRVSEESALEAERFAQALRKEADEKSAAILAASGEKIAQLRQLAAEQKAEWAGQLYKMILDGEIG
ncbi:MAG: hypothetical protein LBJ10_11575 [Clostridiales bacterium]|nr:hypothetical protein [Clostridiales bacterium]